MFFTWPNNRKPLEKSDKLPYHLKKYALAYAQCIYERYEEGEILTQWILGLDYSIWQHYFIMNTDTLVHPNVKEDILTINYMRIGIIDAILKGSGNVTLKTGKCGMFYVPKEIMHDAILPKGISSCVHINFHPSHLIPIAKQYPVFEPMLSQTIQQLKEGKHQVEVDISKEMDEELEKIIRCRLGNGERELFFQARIRDLLRLYSTQLARQQAIEEISNPHEKILAKVEYYIDQHLDKDLSVDILATHAGVSRAWLQRIVAKKQKGGLHKLIIHKRMTAAAEKLRNTDEQISDIAMKTSTLTFAAFSTAFKKFHGMSPAKYRLTYSQNRKK